MKLPVGTMKPNLQVAEHIIHNTHVDSFIAKKPQFSVVTLTQLSAIKHTSHLLWYFTLLNCIIVATQFQFNGKNIMQLF